MELVCTLPKRQRGASVCHSWSTQTRQQLQPSTVCSRPGTVASGHSFPRSSRLLCCRAYQGQAGIAKTTDGDYWRNAFRVWLLARHGTVTLHVYTEPLVMCSNASRLRTITDTWMHSIARVLCSGTYINTQHKALLHRIARHMLTFADCQKMHSAKLRWLREQNEIFAKIKHPSDEEVMVQERILQCCVASKRA